MSKQIHGYVHRVLSGRLPERLKRFCEKQMLVILILILFGDFFKYGQIFGVNAYNWIAGHFADIGLTAQCTTALYYVFGHKRWGVSSAILIPPALFCMYELAQYPSSDPADIACYFSGSIVAMLSIQAYRARIR